MKLILVFQLQIQNLYQPIPQYTTQPNNHSIMHQTQYSRLKNISKYEPYEHNLISLNEDSGTYYKNRIQEIKNEFDLLDFNKRGYLFRGQIQDYLQKKYQWVNKDILNQLFNSIDWKRKDLQGDMCKQERQQFCKKYINRERHLFYQFNKLQSQQQWFNSLFNTYQRTAHLRPSYYVSVQILKLQMYQFKDQFLNIDIRYEDHAQKLQFNINQTSYDPTKPSYELILPAQQNRFFLSYNFTNYKDHNLSYGNTYVQIDLSSKSQILKEQQLNLDVRKNGAIVGRCRLYVSLENNIEVIKQKLKQKQLKIKENLKQKKGLNLSLSQIKRKQYEYLQFLWGIKHMPPAKIQQQHTVLIVILRTILIVLLGCLSIVVHVLGRCQPLGLICVFLMLKWRTYVILKVQVFLMTWLIIAAMLLDGIWLVFSSHHVSQINYLNLHSAMIITYFLLGVKSLFFIYLLAFQKPFQNEEQKDINAQNKIIT